MARKSMKSNSCAISNVDTVLPITFKTTSLSQDQKMVGFINEHCHFKINMKLQALFLTDKLHYKSQDNNNIIILIMKLPLSFDSISVPST